jgi:5'-phosphate synthase pdxT subunit
MLIAVLALQGDFEEHEQVFKNLNIPTCQICQKKDLDQDISGIVLPGGESTVQGKLLHSLDMFDKLKGLITNGLPVMATCAGTILLAEHILDDPTVHLGTLGVTVKRNAYGRQISSSHIVGKFDYINDIPMSFIRAPQIEFCVPKVKVLAEHDGRITAVRQDNQLAMTFHPELGTDYRVAEYFLNEMVKK